MIAGTNSGCGKTTITCGILQALINRKMSVSAFKCGPDYIDPMFHSKIIGAKSRNLDGFFADENTLNFLLDKNGRDSDISIIEGVMGLFDGIGETASSYQLAADTKTPVIAVINCKGMSGSIGAIIKGFLTYRQPNVIVGFIFNQLSQGLCGEVKKICETLGTEYLGYLPKIDDCTIESRHLGLLTACEIDNLKFKMQLLASRLEETVDLNRISALSEKAGNLTFHAPDSPVKKAETPVKIAVAMDRAFCFYYEDNFDLLREAGCEIIPFSPLEDKELPPDISGLIIGGGYPELYAQELSENTSMLDSIALKIKNGLPTVAECGGFMYLHKTLENADGQLFNMVGAINGKAYKTQKLQRFGYIHLTAKTDNLLCKKDEGFPAHEFHYWDSTACGDSFTAKKASNSLTWSCVHSSKNIFAGFPHLYFYSKPEIVNNFISKCLEYNNGQS
jgi:cobyrinic acid a,c-diamide synthase